LLFSIIVWGLIAFTSAAAGEALSRLDDACLNRALYHPSSGIRGCVPGLVFAILAATRYGPALLIPLSSDIAQRWAPLASCLLFALLGCMVSHFAGRRRAFRASGLALSVVLAAEALFFIFLAAAEGLLWL
jgi:hypothetical protein